MKVLEWLAARLAVGCAVALLAGVPRQQLPLAVVAAVVAAGAFELMGHLDRLERTREERILRSLAGRVWAVKKVVQTAVLDEGMAQVAQSAYETVARLVEVRISGDREKREVTFEFDEPEREFRVVLSPFGGVEASSGAARVWNAMADVVLVLKEVEA